MSQDLSDEAIKNAYASVVEPEAVLCSIEADNSAEPILFCDHPDGVTSNGTFYPFYPFTIVFGGASIDEPSKVARLEVANLDGSLIATARTVKRKPRLHVEIVRLAAPNDVEQELVGVTIDDVDAGNESLVFALSPRSFKSEPACKARYIIARTPGLFDGVRTS